VSRVKSEDWWINETRASISLLYASGEDLCQRLSLLERFGRTRLRVRLVKRAAEDLRLKSPRHDHDAVGVAEDEIAGSTRTPPQRRGTSTAAISPLPLLSSGAIPPGNTGKARSRMVRCPSRSRR
jgi:hypothetical protein